jgi:Amt family ammonium transporter
MFAAWVVVGKPDVGFTLNGVLAGLVGITAGPDVISFSGAVLVGLIAGVIMTFSVIGLERVGIDDPVGAISVHGTAGLWGVLAVAIFGGGSFIDQSIGALAIIAWTFVTSFAVFKLVDVLVGIRVSPDEEIAGLDRSEHGGEAYPEFLFQEQIAPSEALDPVGGS